MPDTAQTVTSQPLSETFVGATPEEAVAAAAAKYGPDAQIGDPTKTRTGGVGGFFSRESYQVLVQVGPAAQIAASAAATPDDADSVDDVADLLSAPVPAGAAAPLVYARPVTAGPAPTPTALPSAPAGPQSPFAAALAGVEKSSTVEAAVTRATGAPVPAPAPLVDPLAYAGDIRSFHPASGSPLGPPSPEPTPLPVPALPAAEVVVPAWLRTALDGVDENLLDGSFAQDVATRGETAAITALFGEHYRNPGLPVLDAGEVLVVAGIGAQALTAAYEVAEHIGVTPGSVYAAGGPSCAGAVPAARRLRTTADVTALRAKTHKAPLVVAVDTDWTGPDVNTGAIIAALCAVVTWAAVDATRRDADTARWLAAHRRVDGLVVHNAEHTSAAASLLRHRVPVLFLDGRPATPKRWAGVLTSGASL